MSRAVGGHQRTTSDVYDSRDDAACAALTARPKSGTDDQRSFALMMTVVAKDVDRELHVVADNLGTHFTAEVRNWLAGNPDITCHHAPVGASSSSSGFLDCRCRND